MQRILFGILRMRYCKYFSRINQDNGLRGLSTSQFSRVMNIVYLEGVEQGVLKAKKTLQNSPSKNSLELSLYHTKKRIIELTGNLEPNDLLKEMYRISEDQLN